MVNSEDIHNAKAQLLGPSMLKMLNADRTMSILSQYRKTENKKAARIERLMSFNLAEKGGFEPPLGYYPKHAFQACDLNHSSTSPKGAQDKPERL